MLGEKCKGYAEAELKRIREDNPHLTGNWCGYHAFTQDGGVCAVFEARKDAGDLVHLFQQWGDRWHPIGAIVKPTQLHGWGKYIDVVVDYAGPGHELLAVTGIYKGELAMVTWRRKKTDVWDSTYRVSYF